MIHGRLPVASVELGAPTRPAPACHGTALGDQSRACQRCLFGDSERFGRALRGAFEHPLECGAIYLVIVFRGGRGMRSRTRTVLSSSASVVFVAAITAGYLPSSSAGTNDCAKVIVAAGDMNRLSETEATGRLARQMDPDIVATVGDQQYPDGTLAQYVAQYDTTAWGQMKHKTKSVPGHHEYYTPDAKGYFAYFDKPSYYAYEIGCGWRGYALNSLVGIAEQVDWLRRDLAAHPGVRVVVAWADPRYSSGTRHGGDASVQPFLDAFAGREGIVLNGHEHHYERFAARDQLRQFVVGTGGSASYPFGTPVAGSQRRITGEPGVLNLNVRSGGAYSWMFVNKAGQVLDGGGV